MSKHKYYYAVIDSKTGKLSESCAPVQIFIAEQDAKFNAAIRTDIIPIPAEELNQLIKKYRKK